MTMTSPLFFFPASAEEVKAPRTIKIVQRKNKLHFFRSIDEVLKRREVIKMKNFEEEEEEEEEEKNEKDLE